MPASLLAGDAVAGVRDPRLRAIVADHWELMMRWAPTWATTLGDHRHDDQAGPARRRGHGPARGRARGVARAPGRPRRWPAGRARPRHPRAAHGTARGRARPRPLSVSRVARR